MTSLFEIEYRRKLKLQEERESRDKAAKSVNRKTKYSRIRYLGDASDKDLYRYVNLSYRNLRAFHVYVESSEDTEKEVIQKLKEEIKNCENLAAKMKRDLFALENPNTFLKQEISSVLQAHPLLSYNGFSQHESTEQERQSVIDNFLNIRNLQSIIRQNLSSVQKINTQHSDATLTTLINSLHPDYNFSKGEFIISSILIGYQLSLQSDNSVYFNFSKREIKNLQKGLI